MDDEEKSKMKSEQSKIVSGKSEKYFIQKFTKEIIGHWSTFTLDETNQANETMNYLILKDFLIKLGFTTPASALGAEIGTDSSS